MSLTACGSASTPAAAPTTSTVAKKPPAASPAPVGARQDRTSGVIGSVAGPVVTLTAAHGPGTVDVTPQTRVTQLTPAQLTDVAAGECLVVRPTRDSAGAAAITAASVLFGPVVDGQCARPGEHARHGVIGTVGAVSGNAITITTGDAKQETVTVVPNCRYAKRVTADASAIAAGQCLMATGSIAADGALQATSVAVRPADDGSCGGKR